MLVGGFDSMTRAPHALRTRPGAAHGRRADDRRDGPRRAVLLDRRRGHGRDVGRRERAAGRHARGAGRARGALARQRAPPGASGWPRRSSPLPRADARRGRARDEPTRRSPRSRPRSRADGTITAGNASPGLRRRRGGRDHDRRPRDATRWPRCVGRAVVAGPGLDAAPAPRRGLARSCSQRHGLKPTDIALWEINEAFAGVVLASADRLEIDLERVNVNGGAVALGHPLAGSGLRLVLTLAYELRRRGGGSASPRCAAAAARARRSCSRS